LGSEDDDEDGLGLDDEISEDSDGSNLGKIKG